MYCLWLTKLQMVLQKAMILTSDLMKDSQSPPLAKNKRNKNILGGGGVTEQSTFLTN